MSSAERPDHRSHAKHRDITFSRLTAQILRETRDEPSLHLAFTRALQDPETLGDSILQGMLQAYLGERQAEMRNVRAEQARFETNRTARPTHRPPVEPPQKMLRARASTDLNRLEETFRYHVGHLNEAEARDTYVRLRAFVEANAAHLPSIDVDDYTHALQRLARRRQKFEQHLDDVIGRVTAAAADGQSGRVARLMHRLTSIHSTFPRLLSEDRLEEIREGIVGAAETYEHRLAAIAIIEREKAVASEIKHLAHAIHCFHRIAGESPHDSDAYLAAESAYHAAIEEVEAHDREWLAGFVLELAELLDEWHDPPFGTQGQVDRFLRSVRSSLSQLRLEIRSIEGGITH